MKLPLTRSAHPLAPAALGAVSPDGATPARLARRRRVRPKLLLGLFVLLAALGAGAYVAYPQFVSPSVPAAPGPTVPVRTGRIANTVTTTGNVVANRQARLSFQVAGRLKEVPVKLGDTVAEGQLLAKLDTATLETKVAQAKSTLRTAQIKLDQLKAGARAEDVAAAQAGVASAQKKLDTLLAGPLEADVKAAEQAISAAQTQLQRAQGEHEKLKSGPEPADVQAAEQDVERAKSSLWSTQINRDGLCGNRAIPKYQCDRENASVMAAEVAVKSAQIKLEKVKEPGKPEELAAAQQAIESATAALAGAQARLEQVKAGSTEAEIEAARSALSSARATLAGKLGPTPYDVMLQEEQVRSAEAAVRLAEIDLANASLLAPFAGVVASLSPNPGEMASTGTAIVTLVDPKAVRIDASVDENDVGRLAAGKPARITFDALPEKALNGRVIAVSPNATIQQGVATYLVSVAVDPGDLALPAGMTANVSVTVEEKANVLLVPNRAIRTQGRQRQVEVQVTPGQTERRTIRTGLSNDQFSEVVEGLREGDQVVIPTTTTRPPNAPGGLGGGFGGPGPVIFTSKPGGG